MDKSRIYLDCRPLFATGSVDLLDHSEMVLELKSLERIGRPGGKEKVEHPRGLHDDHANTLCVALAVAMRAGNGGDIKDIAVGGIFLPRPRWDGEEKTPGSGNPDSVFDDMIANSLGSASGGWRKRLDNLSINTVDCGLLT